MTVLSSIAWDMREHKSTEQRLRRQATHDALTDCPNRGLLMDRLEQALHSAERHRRVVGVLFLDLDGFKQINDTLGHEPANTLLRDFSQRLRARLRVEDTLARYGGDEFVMVVPEIGAPSDVEYVTRKVSQALGEPFVVAGKSIRLSASVGVAVYPQDGEDAETLLRKADSRMYRHKKRTKTRAGLAAELPQNFASLARDGGNLAVRTSL
jgi:diguanylate cyclase (GGDEF)-like protein